MRRSGIAAFAFSLAVLALGGSAGARLQDDEETPAPLPTSNIVTLVGWYAEDPESHVLAIGPLGAGEDLVAAAAQPARGQITGQAAVFTDFSGGCITLSTDPESTFNTYPARRDEPGSALRWLFFNDDPNARPSTLVMQVRGTAGQYEGYDGTATLVSRGPLNTSTGIIVVLLHPPTTAGQDVAEEPCIVE